MSTTQELIERLRELEIDMVLDGNMRGVVRNGADRLASLSVENAAYLAAVGSGE